MASTNKTTTLKLSQFVGTDKPDWLTDYNEDMEKIDTWATTADSDIADANNKATKAVNTANGASTSANAATTAANNAVTVANSVVNEIFQFPQMKHYLQSPLNSNRYPLHCMVLSL